MDTGAGLGVSQTDTGQETSAHEEVAGKKSLNDQVKSVAIINGHQPKRRLA